MDQGSANFALDRGRKQTLQALQAKAESRHYLGIYITRGKTNFISKKLLMKFKI